MWAKKATPPPAAGLTSEKPPDHAWKRNQTPMKIQAGTSWSRMKKTKIAVITFARGSSDVRAQHAGDGPARAEIRDPCLLGRAEVERHERLDARGDESEAR